MRQAELRMAQELQSSCKKLCEIADQVDPRRARRGLASQVDKIIRDMAETFYDLTGHSIYRVPSTDLNPDHPALWTKRRQGWQTNTRTPRPAITA